MLIFSFSLGPLHTVWAGGYCILICSQQIFLMKELDKRKLCQEDQCSLYAIVEGFFWILCSRQTRLLALPSLFVRMSLVCVNRDKFRNFMQAADEKLIR